MVKRIFDEMARARPRGRFTIGIHDDVTHTSLDYDPSFSTEDPATVRAVFYGLGADGTVGANKNSIKIIGEETDNHAQGYFVYDSKKSGSVTVSHLRFGPRPIHSTYLISRATFVACHQFSFLERLDVLRLPSRAPCSCSTALRPGSLGPPAPCRPGADHRQALRVFVIDGNRVAREAGMGGRVNTVMQTCFFAISGVLPRDEAIAAIKHSIEKTYGKRGEAVVRKNWAAVDSALSTWPRCRCRSARRARRRPPAGPAEAPGVRPGVTARMIAGRGMRLPRERGALRRHVSDRHGAVGEAQHRARDPRVGRGAVHPMRENACSSARTR
jgi:pyruvate-ferredoxin/flavodoxin oxidoreductase